MTAENPFPEDMDVEGQLEAFTAIGENLAGSAVEAAARDAGRTPEQQWERMADHFSFMAAEQDPKQHQLIDYQEATE